MTMNLLALISIGAVVWAVVVAPTIAIVRYRREQKAKRHKEISPS